MAKLTLIESKPLEEELEEIELPTYDIIVHEDETWFERTIREIEEDNPEQEKKLEH